MKKIEAVIRHHKLDEVKSAVSQAGIQGMTVTEVRAYGAQQSRTDAYRGLEYAVDFAPRVKLEIVVSDQECRLVVEAILSSARTGEPGDGSIVISTLSNAVRVRTGEVAEAAM